MVTMRGRTKELVFSVLCMCHEPLGAGRHGIYFLQYCISTARNRYILTHTESELIFTGVIKL